MSRFCTIPRIDKNVTLCYTLRVIIQFMGYIVKKTVIMPVLAFLVLLFAACGAKNGVSDAGKAHLHEFGNWKVVKKPSCTQDGLQIRICACGEILFIGENALVNALGLKRFDVRLSMLAETRQFS